MVDGMDYQQHLRVEADRLHTRRLPTRGLHPHPSKGGGGSIPCPRSRNFTPRKARDPYDEPKSSQADRCDAIGVPVRLSRSPDYPQLPAGESGGGGCGGGGGWHPATIHPIDGQPFYEHPAAQCCAFPLPRRRPSASSATGSGWLAQCRLQTTECTSRPAANTCLGNLCTQRTGCCLVGRAYLKERSTSTNRWFL